MKSKEEYEDKLQYYKMLSKEVSRLRNEIWMYRVTDFWMRRKWTVVCTGLALVIVVFILHVFVLYRIESKVTQVPENTKIVYDDTLKNMQAFLDDIAELESGGRYDVKNPFGYMGKYQVGRQALTDIGMGGISDEEFLNNPELQEVVMRMLLRKNKKYLQAYIGKYTSKTVGGIYITESGLLAGAHTVGVGGVMQFLDSDGNTDKVDGNGVKVSFRIKRFSGYKLEL